MLQSKDAAKYLTTISKSILQNIAQCYILLQNSNNFLPKMTKFSSYLLLPPSKLVLYISYTLTILQIFLDWVLGLVLKLGMGYFEGYDILSKWSTGAFCGLQNGVGKSANSITISGKPKYIIHATFYTFHSNQNYILLDSITVFIITKITKTLCSSKLQTKTIKCSMQL